MTQFGRFYLPPFGAVINVARETVKSLMPDDSPCLQILRKMTASDRNPQPSENSERPAPLRRQAGYTGVFENTTSYDEIEGENRATKLSYDEQSYQNSGPQKFSVAPGSFDGSENYGDGCGEFKSRHKINEWQAAWNVTNAIQV